MNTAIIDLGTNTFNLFIGRVEQGKIISIVRKTIGVKLGEGGIGYILDSAIERAINALIEIKKYIESNECNKIIAIGTSAIRSASNRNIFLEKVAMNTGIEIQIIDGLREAELIFKGTLVSLPYTLNYPSLMLDIGGGSNEFIIFMGNKIIWKESFPLGVARIKEGFEFSNPILPKEIEAIENYFNQKLTPLWEITKQYPIHHLIGVAGSFESYVELVAEEFNWEEKPANYTCMELDVEQTKIVHQKLIQTTFEERLNMKGLLTLRADMMVISSVFIQFIIQKLMIQKLWVSTYSLREGALLEYHTVNS